MKLCWRAVPPAPQHWCKQGPNLSDTCHHETLNTCSLVLWPCHTLCRWHERHTVHRCQHRMVCFWSGAAAEPVCNAVWSGHCVAILQSRQNDESLFTWKLKCQTCDKPLPLIKLGFRGFNPSLGLCFKIVLQPFKLHRPGGKIWSAECHGGLVKILFNFFSSSLLCHLK